MYSIGGEFLSMSNAGPDGGLADIPNVGVKLAAFNKMVGSYVPNRIIAGGTAIPATWEVAAPGSLASNATVKPLAAPLGCTTPTGGTAITPENCVAATNETPIKIRTAGNHGLATGDRVTIAGVAGNTAANGSFTVTVPATTTAPESPAATVFTLDGSVGNGSYTGGGYAVQCPPNTPNCAAPASRTDISRYRSVANAIDRVAGFRVKAANRFAVVAGQSYRAGAVLEVAEYTAGAYEAQVEWFTAADVSLGTSDIQSRTAVTARTAFSANVTAPPTATKAAVRVQWSGATAEGTAYADSFSFVPVGLRGTLKDNQGVWGEQKIVDFSVDPPAVVGTYKSPTSTVWPPPSNGVYMPREARVLDNDIAFTTWMTDGLRVLDLSDPSTPKQLAAFMPPGVADPSGTAGAGPNNAAGGGSLQRGISWPTQRLITGVDVRKLSATSARIVVSDINGGLSVLDAAIARPAAAPPPPPPPPVAPPPPPPPPPGVAPAPPPAPGPAARRLGRLSAAVTPARDLSGPFRFRTFGRLTLPSGIARSVGCSGRVSVQIKRGGVTISTRRVSLRSNCTYSVGVSFANRRRFGRVKRLTFTVRFAGNSRVLPARAPTRFGRVRR